MPFLRLYIIALFALTTTIASAENTYILRNTFQQDHESFFAVTMDMEGTKRSEGTEQEVSNSMYTLFGFQTDSITESRKANISFKIYQMDYDNPLASGTKPDMMKILGLSNKSMHLTLDDRGSVIHAPNLGKQTQLTEQIPWLVCPDDKIAIGGTWNHKRQVPMTGASKPIIAYTTYTLDSVSEEDGTSIAVITYQTEIDEKDVEVNPFSNQPPGGANLVLKFTFKNYSYSGTGTIRFDMNEGHILSKEEKGTSVQEMESDLSMDGAAFPSNVVNALTLTTKAVYSETKPEPVENKGDSNP